MQKEFIHADETYAILGACFSVYKKMGCGFLEAVYQECLEIEFDFLGIPYESQKKLHLEYRGRVLEQVYRPDFICYDKIILEIKAVSDVIDEHRAQLLNCLNADSFRLGLLVNFGHYPQLQHQRLVK